MELSTRNRNRSSFPEQGKAVGWVVWALLCLLSLFGLATEAVAGTFTPSQTTFPALAVGQTSAPAVITLVSQGTGTANSPSTLTEGTANAGLAEFSVIPNSGTCGSNPTLTPGQTCTVTATFTPRFPGVRHGAVVLQTSGGQLLASTLLSGIGQGPLPVFIPGQIDTVAGNGDHFYEGDGGAATGTSLYLPSGLAVDGAGNLYIADTTNNRVRRVDATTHNITTVAGDGNAGSTGDGGPATAAEITGPSGLALDGAGNLYIADTGNDAIRRVDALSGRISTVAGTLGHANYTGDGGPATSATLNAPQAIGLSASGDLVIADTGNSVIRVVTSSDGYIQTIAGTGTAGFNGDGNATSAQLNEPSGVVVRADGAIAIADLNNNLVRLMTAGGTMTTIAGNRTPGYSGDGGAATQAQLQRPASVVFDPAGDLLIADDQNNCIRFVSHADGTISTLAGTPTDDRYAGDGGPDIAARMHGPDGLVFDAAGNLWIADSFNNRVREVSASLLTVGPYPTMKVGKTSQPVVEAMLNAGNQPLTLNSPTKQQAALDSATTTCGQSSLAPSVLCSMGLEFAPTSVGNPINGSVTWNSNAQNLTSPVDKLYGNVLSVEPTTAAITSSANPGILGQALTLTATVTSADTGRTGTVDFVEGGTTWCSGVALAADGTAQCQIASLSLGNHNFVASYSGDNNNAASQSPVFVETIKQQAALALSVSSSPAVVTSPITLSISAVDGSGTPTGTALFYDGTTALQTVTLDANGNASWTTSSFAVGTHPITAQYSGDAANVPGSTPARTLVINQASTVTVLSSGNNDATVGSTVNLTANVVSNNGPAPTGTVQFFEGATPLGSGPLTNGSASLAQNTLAPGTHTLTAVYSGDTNNATSTSAPTVQTIEQISTVTTLGADVDPVNAGATVTFTAIVSMTHGAVADGALSGTVTFQDGASVLGTLPINATGQASLAVRSLSVGSHAITATFNGSTNYATSNSTPLAEAVQQTPTAISLGANSASTLMGKPAGFTAVVTSATGTPTGSVTFKDGSTVLGTSPLDSHGDAAFSTTGLAAGTHTITGIYSGDQNYLSSTSAGASQTVHLAPTTLSLSSASTVFDAGTTAQFVAALASPGLPPTGTLSLFDGATLIATQPVSAAGSFTFTTTRLPVGSHSLTASYSGDGNNASVVGPAISVTVRQANTTTTLTASANPLTQSTPLTLTATVTSDSPNETGSITFSDGPTVLATVPLRADGTATLQASTFSLGTHPLTAAYTGDTNHAGSLSTTLPELVVQSSSLTLSSSLNPSISGLTVSFSAQVAGYPSPTGQASFRDNGTLLGTAALNANGIAVLSTPTLGVGTHTISVTYSGDANFSVCTTQLTQTVLNATTQTALTSSTNPATYGQPVSLLTTVASTGGVATGTVTFSDAGTPIGSAPLSADGHAVLTLSTFSPGSHLLTATYTGDGKANPSGSEPITVTVKQATSLAVSSDTNPTQTLSPINLGAFLSTPGAAPATGIVTFTDDNLVVLGTAPVDNHGHATLTVPQLSAGTHNIVASYAGDGANFASTSPAYKQGIQLRPTTTTVTGTPTDPANPQQMTLIAVVKGSGSTPPSGTVNFMAGNITLGAAGVDATGVAAITVNFETPTQQVTALYAGDISYAASQSRATPITAGTPAQFTVAVSSSNLTLVSHQHTSITVTVASVKGFTDTIALGCLGLPYAATCTYDNSQLKLAPDGTTTASLVIDTGDPLGAGTGTSAALRSSSTVLACCLPAALLLAGISRRARRKRVTLLLAVICSLAIGFGATGCSGLQVSGTPPGSYTFRVIGTGQGSNSTEAQTVTLVVTQ